MVTPVSPITFFNQTKINFMKKLHELKADQLFIFVGKKGIFSMVESNEKNVTFSQCVIAGDGKPYAMQKAICRHSRTKIYNSNVIAIVISGGTF